MQPPSRLLVIGLLTALLGACRTTYHYAEFIAPSEIYVPAKLYRIGVVNRVTDPEQSAEIYIQGLPLTTAPALPVRAAEATVRGLIELNAKSGRYDMQLLEWPEVDRDERIFMAPALDSLAIDSLCRSFGLDGVIALEGLNMVVRTNGDLDVVTVTDPMGNPVNVPEFTQDQQVALTVGWRFYEGFKLGIYDTFQETYERVFSQEGFADVDSLSKSPTHMKMLDVAYEAADDYLERIAPHWVQDYRRYYSAGSDDLYSIAYNLTLDGNWLKAAEAWKQLAQSGSKEEKYMASFNMALASEMLGNPEVALDWLEKAAALEETKLVADYREKLKKQVLVQQVINVQLGLEAE